MEKDVAIYWIFGFAVLIVIGFFVWNNSEIENGVTPIPATKPESNPTSMDLKSDVINFESYNIDYMNNDVRSKLLRQVGNSGKTAFYLPSTGYVNVSRGTKYGVAFVIQNVDPKIPEGNRFAYSFDAGFENCGVGLDIAQSWIERGWASNGVIGGQWREDWNEWYDAMTIYFSFPSDIEVCNVKYNFVITKDGEFYDSRTLEFNLV